MTSIFYITRDDSKGDIDAENLVYEQCFEHFALGDIICHGCVSLGVITSTNPIANWCCPLQTVGKGIFLPQRAWLVRYDPLIWDHLPEKSSVLRTDLTRWIRSIIFVWCNSKYMCIEPLTSCHSLQHFIKDAQEYLWSKLMDAEN